MTTPTTADTTPVQHRPTNLSDVSNQTNSSGLSQPECPDSPEAPMPDYYGALGLQHTASHKEVELAFKKKASELYPGKHADKAQTQKDFNAVTNAYSVLSDPARRDDYDQIMHFHFDKQQALETFEKFFRENGILQEEEEFFRRHYPDRQPTDYEVLGLNRKANLQQIQQAYKSLALKYHPKNCPGDSQAEEQFRRVSQAYFHLKDQFRRKIYDAVVFDRVPTFHAHAQFNNVFLDDEQFEDQHDKELLGEFVRKTSSKEGCQTPPPSPATPYSPYSPYSHRQVLDEEDATHESEVQREVVQTKGPDGLLTKTTTKSTRYVRGRPKTVTREEVARPDGTTEVTETTSYLGRSQTNHWTAGKK